MMKLDEFKSSLTGAAPPASVSTPLQALWWEGKGDWHCAHDLLQNESGAAGSWVHAYLHRQEPDPSKISFTVSDGFSVQVSARMQLAIAAQAKQHESSRILDPRSVRFFLAWRAARSVRQAEDPEC